ncbi:MAG: matrixin family metalloprotease [Xenococcaceae cyanobacterium]
MVNIFNAAADWWERAILDDFTLTLNFGWASLGGNTLGSEILVSQGGTPNRETEGTIRFDNDGSTTWFLDRTPHDDSEYNTFTEFEQDLGGGTINVGRVYTDPNINAARNGFDLLSVAKHEIGHALGLGVANQAYQNETRPDNDIDVTGSRPNAGTVIRTNNSSVPATNATFNAHINAGQLPNTLMVPTSNRGERKLQSAADILAVAQLSQFTHVNLDPKHVPEPTAAPLALVLAMGVGTFLKKNSPQSKEESLKVGDRLSC